MRQPLFLTLLCLTVSVVAEAFDFDLDALEKKPFEWHGLAEARYEGLDLNRSAGLYPLTYTDGEAFESRWSSDLELSGDYRYGESRFSATWHGQILDDDQGTTRQGRLYEAYFHHEQNNNLSWELGKRTLKWGKGYAWNPVAFVERPKDAVDPDLGREGYIMAIAEWVKSGNGPLQTIGFTPLLLPVRDNFNEAFGQKSADNIGGKLYLLYHDVDIDLLFLSDGTRPGRIGVDFSLNLASHIELHGEWAYIPDYPKQIVSDGQLITDEQASHSILFGLRYLSEADTTWIIELLHQGHGYNKKEMDAYFSLLSASPNPWATRDAGQQAGFLRPNPMRNYLYLRASQKEPFDWLYTSLSLTAITNLDDDSHMLMPELAYTGVENLELRLRLNLLRGGHHTEYGEKLNENKLELRLRYFF